MKFDISPGAKHILQALARTGHEAWLVGGCVRDLLRGVRPHDWDICTSARPEQTAACFAGQRVIRTGFKHGTVTVLADGKSYEITTYRAEGPYSDSRRPDFVHFVPDLEDDLARRDFTMNAIALGPDGDLRDPFGGRTDIRAGLIRCVGDPSRRLREDGLRLMRALRFSASFGYQIEEKTARAIHDSRAVLKHVSAERINVELCGLLMGETAGDVLREYPDVLCEFWPELRPLLAPEENNSPHCRGDWEHTIRAIEAAPAELIPRLAILLQNIGARPADQTLRALKFDSTTRQRVVTLVEYHNVPIPCREQDILKWLGQLGPETFFRLLEVKRADCMAQPRELAGDRLAELKKIKISAEETIAQGQCFSLRDLAVNGRDVIAAGVAPGPEVGLVLKELLERVLNGEIQNNREELLGLVANMDPR